MTMTETTGKALLVAPKDASAPAAQQIVEVARRFGVSPVRQLRERLALKFGPARLDGPEYYANGLYDPAISPEAKKEYVGIKGSYQINVACSPMELTLARATLRDKVMYTALLRQLGLPTTRTQAVAHATRHFGAIPALSDTAAVCDFLMHRARYPLFGKPCEGEASVGSVMIRSLDAGARTLRLANGRDIDLDAFAREIFTDYPEGFIFQDTVRQDPALVAFTGDAVGTMRVVTLRDQDRARVLYAVWKVPSPTAMSDNFWQAGSMVAQVDAETGRVGPCWKGTGLNGGWIETHPVSGLRFEGFRVPHWAQVRDVAERGHQLFPEFGIVGWDIAVGPDGPVIIECNDNPYHVLWQLANRRGIRNAEFMPAFDEAARRSRAILAGKVATYRARVKAKSARG
ncbi:MAG: hypothetical protein EP307_11450 [Rhodobacteraceae bacterium]|nr:MAG: hypothetical protein EP307_11450 [Paracoccaceae bacterium]